MIPGGFRGELLLGRPLSLQRISQRRTRQVQKPHPFGKVRVQSEEDREAEPGESINPALVTL